MTSPADQYVTDMQTIFKASLSYSFILPNSKFSIIIESHIHVGMAFADDFSVSFHLHCTTSTVTGAIEKYCLVVICTSLPQLLSPKKASLYHRG